MVRQSDYDGIVFVEGTIEDFVPIKKLSTTLNSGFGQDQLKSLTDVKRLMASEAKAIGGNCIINFDYGQKAGSIWQQLWSVDNILWYGTGVIGTKKSSSSGNSANTSKTSFCDTGPN